MQTAASEVRCVLHQQTIVAAVLCRAVPCRGRVLFGGSDPANVRTLDSGLCSFADNAARFYSALRETPWAEHVKIVLKTGAGMKLNSMNVNLWQPLTNMSLDTWADFSLRLPKDMVNDATVQLMIPLNQEGSNHSTLPPRLQPADGSAPYTGPLPVTYEGGEVRCFRHMFVCLHDINTRTWQLHAYGQSLVRYYGGSAMVASQTEQHPPGQQFQVPPPVSIIRQLGLQRGSGAKEQQAGTSEEQVLRIVFQKRDGGDRQIANVAELIERCNAWRYTTQAGARLRALCWEVSEGRVTLQIASVDFSGAYKRVLVLQVEMPSMQAGIAAAQQADIMVGVHGANIANAWLMRPGSSVLEVTMFEFDLRPAHKNLATRNEKVRRPAARLVGRLGLRWLDEVAKHSVRLPSLGFPLLPCRTLPPRSSSGNSCCVTPRVRGSRHGARRRPWSRACPTTLPTPSTASPF